MADTVNQSVILHLFGWDKKFFLPFRDFIRKHFADDQHKHFFIVYGNIKKEELLPSSDTDLCPSILKSFFKLSRTFQQAEKIILHGLFSRYLIYILAIQPWLLKKCYWVVWGGDLYAHEAENKGCCYKIDEFFRKIVIKRIGHFITYIKKDYDLACKWYRAAGEYHECIMYLSNVYVDYQLPAKTEQNINILMGNSANPSNNHSEIFEKLIPYKNEDIKIYCPLSYGDQKYAGSVIKNGAEIFGKKFMPLTAFMPFDEYMKLLANIDIAIFAHKRQQAMGNTITLLGLGKKVYMRSDTTQWQLLTKIGIKIYDINSFNIVKNNKEIVDHNQAIISGYFSESTLLKQLREILQ